MSVSVLRLECQGLDNIKVNTENSPSGFEIRLRFKAHMDKADAQLFIGELMEAFGEDEVDKWVAYMKKSQK